MTYSYIRVSSDRQTTENQRFEISRYLAEREIAADRWIEETVSGTKSIGERKLGKLLRRMKGGDTLIVSEISRLGRNLMQIMGILNTCMERGFKIIAIKENYELGDNINSKVLAFAFGLSAEIERNLISQRTKEALARKKAEGVKLGRPCGNDIEKLLGMETEVRQLISQGYSKAHIMRRFGVSRQTLYKFIKQSGIAEELKPSSALDSIT